MIRRQCGLCTKRIAAGEVLAFIGEANARYYLEPPLHQPCAAYAVQVCPRLHAAGERIEVALTGAYDLWEDRITGATPEGNLWRAQFRLGDPAARLLAVLEFYLAYPVAPRRVTAPSWLAELARQAPVEPPNHAQGIA
ncbi:hypothetical protein [Streptomyces alboflavus]|nr:hypothetical protein [Streptomyces alboflavus]